MPQTMYNRPWPRWLALAVALPLTALVIALAVTRGPSSPATWIVLGVEAFALVALTVLDPEVTIESRRALPDGRVVTVRRPIVGFKKLERRVGVSGGYEVRVDGFRYEEAYLRI